MWNLGFSNSQTRSLESLKRVFFPNENCFFSVALLDLPESQMIWENCLMHTQLASGDTKRSRLPWTSRIHMIIKRLGNQVKPLIQ